MEKFATLTELTSVTIPKREISSSIGLEIVLAETCAVAPGMLVITRTSGGVESGKRFLGSVINATIPRIKKPPIIENNR